MRPCSLSLLRSAPLSSVASTSSAGSIAPLLQRAFSLSTPLLESKEKRVRRLGLKKVKQRNADLKEDWFNTQPDPFLGMQLVYADGVPVHEQRWRQTKLAATLLEPSSLWTTGPNAQKNVFGQASNVSTSSSSSADPDDETLLPLDKNKWHPHRIRLPSPVAKAFRQTILPRLEESVVDATKRLLGVHPDQLGGSQGEEKANVPDEVVTAESPLARNEIARLECTLRETLNLICAEGQSKDELSQTHKDMAQWIVAACPPSVQTVLIDRFGSLDKVSSHSTSPSPPSSQSSSSSSSTPSSSPSEPVDSPSTPSSPDVEAWREVIAKVMPFVTNSVVGSQPRDESEWLLKAVGAGDSTAAPSSSTPAPSATPSPSLSSTDIARPTAEPSSSSPNDPPSFSPSPSSSSIVPFTNSLRSLDHAGKSFSSRPLAALFSPTSPLTTFRPPPFINYLASPADLAYIFHTLPLVSAHASLATPPGVKLSLDDLRRRRDEEEDAMDGELRSLDAMSRILSLRNASAKGIRAENRRRVVEAFGEPEVKSLARDTPKPRSGPDTGCPEVQAALLTMDIRNLRAHLIKNMHDTLGTYRLRKMAHKRKRILEYLKRLDRVRYDKCLMEIGVDKRAVEGELVIHKFWRQVAPAGKSVKDVKYVGRASLPGHAGRRLPAHKKIHPKEMGDMGLKAYY